MNSPVSPDKSVKYDGESLNLNGKTIKEAIAETKRFVKAHKLGRVKVNYRLRDAIFSRQRYWGEPFPVYYKNGIPQMIPEECLPIELPQVDKFLPTETGEPPLGNAQIWAWDEQNKKIVDKKLIDEKTVFPIELYIHTEKRVQRDDDYYYVLDSTYSDELKKWLEEHKGDRIINLDIDDNEPPRRLSWEIADDITRNAYYMFKSDKHAYVSGGK